MERTRELLVNMGPQHPSTHGVLRLMVKLDGEQVTWCEPDVGYLHRCFEKLSEQKTYPQVIPYTDRTDYLAALLNEQCYVEAVEKLFGDAIQVPERALYIRVLMAELQRITSHLLALGSMAMDLGAVTPFLYCWRDREKIYSIFERITGGRMLYNYLRIGGVRNDLPEGIIGTPQDGEDKSDKTIWGFINYFDSYVYPEWDALVTGNRIFQYRTKGIGVLTPEQAVAYSASGAVLRGSGVKWDLRKNLPYSIYDRLEFDIPVGQNGDCFDRWWVRQEEMLQSSRIVKQCLQWLAENPGPVMAPKVPRVLKPPKGEVYHRIEGARGEVACYVVSDGSANPYKVKWRSPAFTHLQLMPLLVPGHKIADIIAILGSIDVVLGEVDR
ncbi:NADH-quinone oxidoreductase subunit D [Symbiobacterium terraclitae]|uniref:NADH-quinone oxidoreductase subunit D n=2 Tax=Symbiobacterium terraclitae TaxID=557451 RepID=A0ABS4JXS1_9FIRM|nr:NADH-quinone oxidoreductase subunit D [Symbiobacterium terraclitae]